VKIAIIGTGISGLVSAWLLQREHDVHLFEANHYIGGHTNTIKVAEQDRTVNVDTGFIVFNEHNYPNLCRLFDVLGVESRDSNMSFSVHCERTGLEYNGTGFSGLFCQRQNLLNPRFWGMLKDIMRFHQQAPGLLQNGLDDTTTVDQFVREHGYGKQFVDYYLVPLGASLWSAPARRFRTFPMRFVLEFLDNHCMLQVKDRPKWKTVSGGSSQYVDKLTRGFQDRIRLNTPVKAIRRLRQAIEVTVQDGSAETFDEVIVATHADQALRLVGDMQAEERALLCQFPYQDNEVILHTDTAVLPDRQSAWASWNYRIPNIEKDHVSVTYNMNMLQGLQSDKTYCVSLNQSQGIDPGKIIKRIPYHHPLFQPGRQSAQARHAELIRRDAISYCGAYWGYGFHEDGVRSALAVCSAFGQGLD